MSLEPAAAKQLRRLAERHRAARQAADDAHTALVAGLQAAKDHATVRELAELTGISHQRVHQLLTKP